MGFRKGKLFVLLSMLILGYPTTTKGQEFEPIDFDFIFNEWALSDSESEDDILVYRDEDDFIFNDIAYDPKLNLKFKRSSDVCYLKATRPRKLVNRCGTLPRQKPSYVYEGVKWVKKKWELLSESEGNIFLLKHFVANGGGGYRLLKSTKYEILDLDEDRLVLLKIVAQSVN